MVAQLPKELARRIGATDRGESCSFDAFEKRVAKQGELRRERLPTTLELLMR